MYSLIEISLFRYKLLPINYLFIFLCILSTWLQMAPGKKKRPPIIPKELQEHVNPG